MSDQPRLSDQFKNEVESPHHLKHVQIVEKQVLPTQQDVEQEKEHLEFKNSIEQFDEGKLKHVETDEKNSLPTEEQILKEKVPKQAASFDQTTLSHVEPIIKHNIEVIEQ